MKAENKTTYMSLLEEGVRIDPDRDLMNTIYRFLFDIGARNEIPTDKNESQAYLIRWHEALIRSPHWPEKVPFYEVYAKFMSEMLNGSIDRKGNNIQAIVMAFQRWVDLKGGKDKIWPHLQPKTLQPVSYDDDVTGRLETWPDEVLIQQAETISMIWGSSIGRLAESLGANHYRRRIYQEMNRRGITQTETVTHQS